MAVVHVVVPLVHIVILAACAPDSERAEATRTPATAAAPAPGARATARLDPEDGQWTRPAKDYAGTRYSQLGEITAANVARLAPAWSYSTGVLRGHEEAPLVVGGTMYVVTPFPNELHALDLARGGTLKWIYRPRPESAAQGVACCDVVNRGAVYDNGRIYFNTLDNNVVAVDAAKGK